jgi:hypothetical protein
MPKPETPVVIWASFLGFFVVQLRFSGSVFLVAADWQLKESNPASIPYLGDGDCHVCGLVSHVTDSILNLNNH